MLRGGVLGHLVRVLHRMHAPGKAVTPADGAPGAGIPSYDMAIARLLPCFASIPEVWATLRCTPSTPAGLLLLTNAIVAA